MRRSCSGLALAGCESYSAEPPQRRGGTNFPQHADIRPPQRRRPRSTAGPLLLSRGRLVRHRDRRVRVRHLPCTRGRHAAPVRGQRRRRGCPPGGKGPHRDSQLGTQARPPTSDHVQRQCQGKDGQGRRCARRGTGVRHQPVDRQDRRLHRQGLRQEGYRQLRRFARRWPQAVWAVEGAAGLGAPLTARSAAEALHRLGRSDPGSPAGMGQPDIAGTD